MLFRMWRRGLILTLALNLLALVPVPLSACAVLSGLDAPCQCAMPARCGPTLGTNSASNGPAITCLCVQAKAPLPDAVQTVVNAAPAVLASNFPSSNTPAQPVSRAGLLNVLAASDLAPSGSQARLCVFLI